MNPKDYDVAKLVAKLKARGLDLAEEGAKGVVTDVLDWVQESVQKSPTPWDDILLAVLPELRKQALAEIDKIDGQVG